MTSKNSCQNKYQSVCFLTDKPWMTATLPVVAQTAVTSKRLLLGMAMVGLFLTGCQSTPTDDLLGDTPYQTSTRPSNDRNLDQQEIARVRTSLAAQYIRKNELDTAQRQLEKAFAADSRYALSLIHI